MVVREPCGGPDVDALWVWALRAPCPRAPMIRRSLRPSGFALGSPLVGIPKPAPEARAGRTPGSPGVGKVPFPGGVTSRVAGGQDRPGRAGVTPAPSASHREVLLHAPRAAWPLAAVMGGRGRRALEGPDQHADAGIQP